MLDNGFTAGVNVNGDDWFNGAKIEVDIDGDASTSDDIYVRTIKDYARTDYVVTVATPFVRKSVVSGKTATKTDGTGATTTALYICDPAATQWSSREVATTDDAYNGMYLLIDLDGYPGTIDDIELQEINDYDGSTAFSRSLPLCRRCRRNAARGPSSRSWQTLTLRRQGRLSASTPAKPCWLRKLLVCLTPF